MPVVPDAASVYALPMILGPDASSLAPTTWDVPLFDGDPRGDGVELDSTGGYARGSITNASDWDLTSNPGIGWASVTFDTSTGDWSATAYFAALANPAHDGVWWFVQELADPITITASGVAPVIDFRAVFANPSNYT